MVRRAFGSAIDDHTIEDVYASAWLGTLRNLERRHAELDDDEIRRYLFTAVARQASRELRRRRRRPVAPLDNPDLLGDGQPPLDERADRAERSRVTRDLLSSLPRRRRAVLMLRYGWGLEPKQVCALIDGLSPRAYRKEITRGVDQLAERMRLLEDGRWCADREPILKVFAAGLADDEQTRQAKHHLAHCRQCADFVSRLAGHLHDLGGSFALPAVADLAADGRLSLPGRIADATDRVRESATGVFARGTDSASDAGAIAPPIAPRGAGAAGAGALAKIVGLDFAGKAVVACLGGGTAAVCLATAIGPIGPIGLGIDRAAAPERAHHAATDAPQGPPALHGILPSQVGATDLAPAHEPRQQPPTPSPLADPDPVEIYQPPPVPPPPPPPPPPPIEQSEPPPTASSSHQSTDSRRIRPATVVGGASPSEPLTD
jgi:RNA polymerase sigma factor (sigma-70 family)